MFRRLIEEQGLEDRITADSAGTHAYHVGYAPDARAQAAARERGIDLSMQRARQIEPADLTRYDDILAMDRQNLTRLRALRPGANVRLGLLLDYAANTTEREVPDPYYGGSGGFERVFDLVESGCRGLLAEIENRTRQS